MACCVVAAYLFGLFLRPLRRLLGIPRDGARPRPQLAAPESLQSPGTDNRTTWIRSTR